MTSPPVQRETRKRTSLSTPRESSASEPRFARSHTRKLGTNEALEERWSQAKSSGDGLREVPKAGLPLPPPGLAQWREIQKESLNIWTPEELAKALSRFGQMETEIEDNHAVLKEARKMVVEELRQREGWSLLLPPEPTTPPPPTPSKGMGKKSYNSGMAGKRWW